jgi:hypothetical protein
MNETVMTMQSPAWNAVDSIIPPGTDARMRKSGLRRWYRGRV